MKNGIEAVDDGPSKNISGGGRGNKILEIIRDLGRFQTNDSAQGIEGGNGIKELERLDEFGEFVGDGGRRVRSGGTIVASWRRKLGHFGRGIARKVNFKRVGLVISRLVFGEGVRDQDVIMGFDPAATHGADDKIGLSNANVGNRGPNLGRRFQRKEALVDGAKAIIGKSD